MPVESVVTSPATQYTVVAALVLFVVGFLALQRDRDKRSAEEERKTAKFYRDLTQKGIETQEAQILIWQDMLRESIEAQQETARALSATVVELEENDKRANERHLMIIGCLEDRQ